MIKILLILTLVFCFFTCPTILHADDITARSTKVYTVPGNYQIRIEYTSNLPIYVGYAPKGLGAAQTGWFIQKLTWTGSDCTLIQTSTGTWDGRSGLVYS